MKVDLSVKHHFNYRKQYKDISSCMAPAQSVSCVSESPSALTAHSTLTHPFIFICGFKWSMRDTSSKTLSRGFRQTILIFHESIKAQSRRELFANNQTTITNWKRIFHGSKWILCRSTHSWSWISNFCLLIENDKNNLPEARLTNLLMTGAGEEQKQERNVSAQMMLLTRFTVQHQNSTQKL